MNKEPYRTGRNVFDGTITRRTALGGVLGLGGAVILSGCDRDKTEGAASSSAPPTSTSASASSSTSASSSAVTGQPKPGGKLRIGMSTGGSADVIDPHKAVSTIDAARAGNIFDRLSVLDEGGGVSLELAESFTPNADATEWILKLRPGVTWHDGKKLTSKDVIYTLNRIADPAKPLAGKSKVAIMDLPKVTAVDELTVRIPLLKPIADLPVSFTIFYMAIIQDGATDEQLSTKPIGTGPFSFVSLDPGKNSVMRRNPSYWKTGQPYVDELQLITIADGAARLNALLTGQVEAVEALDFQQATDQKAAGKVTVLQTSPGQIVPMTMRTDTAPFDDVRVRQAFRLIADRKKLIEVAQLGVGDIGNDLFGGGLDFYANDLPQRDADIAKAKELLAAAGHKNLTVELNTSSVAPGMLESATAFAAQAKAAGVTVKLKRIPDGEFYGAGYLKYPFGQTQWTSQPIPSWLDDAVVTGAPYNETAWTRPDFDAKVAAARGELDKAKRTAAYAEIQKILYDEGGYIIWGDAPFNDALALNVKGVRPISAQALGNYQFRDWWLA